MRPVRRDLVAFLDFRVFAQQHRAHLVFFQVHGDAGNAVRELDQLAGHDLFQAVNARDAVAHRDHRADFGDIDRAFVILDLLAQNAGDFVRSNLSHNSFLPINLPRSGGAPAIANWPRTEPSYTVEPMRATTPPISAGSTANRIRMRLPVSRSSSRRHAPRAALPSVRAADDTSAPGESQALIHEPLRRP